MDDDHVVQYGRKLYIYFDWWDSSYVDIYICNYSKQVLKILYVLFDASTINHFLHLNIQNTNNNSINHLIYHIYRGGSGTTPLT